MLKITDLTRLAEALSGIELIQEIDQLKAEVNSHRPISKEIQDRIFQKFRLEWNYNSNAIEGNNLTYGETVALIMHGVTAKGKPLKDHLDVKGHNKGINLLLDIVKSERDFTQNDIRSLHEIILVEAYSSKTITTDGIPATRNISIGQYKTVPNHVKTRTGEMHYYASPAETPALMDELMDWYEAAKKNEKIHPFIIASLFHHRFVSIHPFDDGNGRMTRILMNLILMRNQYPLIVVPMKLREEYYGVLSQADVNDFEPLVQYFGDLLKHSLGIQLKGIKGEDISESDDIDKEIELFKKSLTKKHKSNKKDSGFNLSKFLKEFFNPLIKSLIANYKKIEDLFEDSSYVIIFPELKDLEPRKSRITLKYLEELGEESIWVNHALFSSCGFSYSWRSFKKLSPSFDITYLISLETEEDRFSIYYGKGRNVQVVNKKYEDIITQKEISDITSFSIREVISEIKEKINQ